MDHFASGLTKNTLNELESDLTIAYSEYMGNKQNKDDFEFPLMGPESGIKLGAAMAAIDSTFMSLYLHEHFLGGLGSAITKRSDPEHKTAYVSIEPKKLEVVLGFNPYWVGSLSDHKKTGVFKHEYFHVASGHLVERMPANHLHRKIANISMDLSINCFIPDDELPDICLVPGKLPKHCSDPKLGLMIKNFPKNESHEYYYEELLKYQKSLGDNTDISKFFINGGTLDDHENWIELPEEMREVMREEIRQMVGEGIRRAEQKGSWGNVPQAFKNLIAKLMKREVDWRSIIKMFIGMSRSTEQTCTIKRLNKKVPYEFPGFKRKTKARFLYAIDQSGSMSNEEVQKGISELFSLSRETEIDSINFDTEVDLESFQTWSKSKTHEWKRTRSGGTDFECVRRFVSQPQNRKRWSGIIIFTDGYAAGLGQIIGARVLWLITETGTIAPVRKGDIVVQMKFPKKVEQK